MKRNLDLFRIILLEIEKMPAGEDWMLDCSSNLYSDECEKIEICEHLILMQDADLISKAVSKGSDNYYELYPCNMTNQGYDFLDAVRSSSIWKRVKDSVIKNGGSFSIEIITSLAKKYIAEGLGL